MQGQTNTRTFMLDRFQGAQRITWGHPK